MDQNLYYERDMMADSPMSLWGSPQVYKYKPVTVACTTPQVQKQVTLLASYCRV